MILIFGANGKLGRALCDALTAPLTAAVRSAPRDDFFTQNAIPTVQADVLDKAQCEAVVRAVQPTVVISTVGGKNADGVRSDGVGNINIIDAVAKHAPNATLVLVTSVGCGEQWAMMSERFQQALGEAITAKTAAEDHLKASALNWLIVRPGGLTDGEAHAVELACALPAQHSVYVSRQSVARAIATLIAQGAQRQCVSVVSAKA
ncbi:SDR family oxidoreductase [Pasteurellaceae bacterium TAE3-ERU1]|nr:SDR family oxidoreductase [Pasteurellaceae bacterium TAE3-ERU1]